MFVLFVWSRQWFNLLWNRKNSLNCMLLSISQLVLDELKVWFTSQKAMVWCYLFFEYSFWLHCQCLVSDSKQLADFCWALLLIALTHTPGLANHMVDYHHLWNSFCNSCSRLYTAFPFSAAIRQLFPFQWDVYYYTCLLYTSRCV